MPSPAKEKMHIDWYDVTRLAKTIAKQLQDCSPIQIGRILGIGRGGLIPAGLIAYHYGLLTGSHPVIESLDVSSYEGEKQGDFHIHGTPHSIQTGGVRTLIVDDIADTGNTLSVIKGMLPNAQTAVLVHKASSSIVPDYYGLRDEEPDKYWYVFPWERED